MGHPPLENGDAHGVTPPHPAALPGDWQGGMTRVTLARGNHRFEFRCDPGSEALLARAVLDMAGREGSPLSPGDAFGLVRQIEAMSPPGSSRPNPGEAGPWKKAA